MEIINSICHFEFILLFSPLKALLSEADPGIFQGGGESSTLQNISEFKKGGCQDLLEPPPPFDSSSDCQHIIFFLV
jgi:hypothetical protein